MGERDQAMRRRSFFGTAAAAGAAVRWSPAARAEDRPAAPAPPSVTLTAGDLTAVIGDNRAADDHRAGYNGVWSLRHRLADRSLFVPGIAGLNLEHIVTGSPLVSDDLFFEPRRAPMTLRPVDDTAASLHQPATPVTGVESTSVFRVCAPHILDMTFECRPRKAAFPHGYLALFWASYINAPDDKSIYFLGGREGQPPSWTQFCTQFHNDQSTVRHRKDDEPTDWEPDGRDALFRNFSKLRFDAPFFYGHFAGLTWLVLFDRSAGIRFTHSPSGGGFDDARRTTHPAWDFQFLIRSPRVDERYGFAVRTILCPPCDRGLIPDMAAEWQRMQSAAPIPDRE